MTMFKQQVGETQNEIESGSVAKIFVYPFKL